jgi:simple sugar transport system ATP-binding protein
VTSVLDLASIRKRFGPVTALDGVDFTLSSGEIHGLLGENGAGKSTLMHVAFGMIRPDAGRVAIRGGSVALSNPRDAKALGIGMVHQHFTSVPQLTVSENLWLAAGRTRAGVGFPPVPSDTGALARLRTRLWNGLSPGVRAETLPVGAKQRLEILQALATGADILLLDEPTAVLAPPEITELLELLREFVEAGGAVVMITHKLTEVFAAVDRVTVLRGGRVTASGPIQDQTVASLTRAMIGPTAEPRTGSVVGLKEGATKVFVRSGGLEVRGGEIVGVAAVEGNGQRELLRRIAGLPADPTDHVELPLAFIPEDRTTEGLVPGFSLTENIVLGLSEDSRWRRGLWLDWSAARSRTAELLGEFSIRASGPDAPARTLSGGNQQKVVFARALEAGPRVLIAENPTRGLDVNATVFVHDRLRRVAAEGAAVLVYSTDLDEVLSLASRVVVVFRGEVRSAPADASREAIGAMMTGGIRG